MTPQAYAQTLQTLLPVSADECDHAVHRAIRYGADPMDALQTLAEWHLSGRPTKWSSVLSGITRHPTASRHSLDAEIAAGLRLSDTLAAAPKTQDATEPIVLTGIHHAVRRGWLTRMQAGVIWAHVCEGNSLSQIGRMVGYADHTTVQYHYRRGMERLRRVYEEVTP